MTRAMDGTRSERDFRDAHKRKIKKNALIIGGIIAATALVTTYINNIGEMRAEDKLIELTKKTSLHNPYITSTPKQDISKDPAKFVLLNMQEGEDFFYKGKIVTLYENIDEGNRNPFYRKQIFVIGDRIKEIESTNLTDTTTIEDAFK
jgi:hypothetical protein